VLQLTCRISALGKWIALQPPTYTRLAPGQVERGGERVEACVRARAERSLVQILIEVATSLHTGH
jgi:hypothetical protein